MAFTGKFATQQEIFDRAGKNVSLSAQVDVTVNNFAAQSESIINLVTRRNWSDDFASANEDVKRILSAASAAYCARHMIAFDMSGNASPGLTSRVEAEDMINVQRDDFLFLLNVLLDQKAEDFMDKEKNQ